MSVDIRNSPILRYAELKLIDDVEFWDMIDLPVYIAHPNDVKYVTKGGDRLDLLAQQFYQDPLLLWVIAWANDIELIPPVMDSGVILTIPDIVFVKSKLARGLVNSRM